MCHGTLKAYRPADLIWYNGVNVLHIAKDMLFSLGQARGALAADGWLVIGECLRPYPNQPIYAELVFQISGHLYRREYRSRFSSQSRLSDRRSVAPGITRAGFERVEVTPEMDRIREIYPHFSLALFLVSAPPMMWNKTCMLVVGRICRNAVRRECCG